MTQAETTDPALPAPSSERDRIRAWLIERIACYLPELADRIGPETDLVGQGLDSVYAVSLCGEIEDAWQLIVEPTLVWDAETVGELAERIVGLRTEQHPAPGEPRDRTAGLEPAPGPSGPPAR